MDPLRGGSVNDDFILNPSAPQVASISEGVHGTGGVNTLSATTSVFTNVQSLTGNAGTNDTFIL